VIGIFKQKNPGNAFVLLIYALVIKFPFFLHPEKHVASEGDNFIFKLTVQFLEPVTKSAPILYPLIAFLLIFTQATLLNRIANNLRLLPKSNFLVGMAYILISSLVHEWSLFSAPMLVNSLLIWIWYRMTTLYNHNSPKTAIFNISMLVGILPLIYSPALVFLILLFFSLILTRPFRVTEWLVAVLGYTTPYYFIFVALYLSNQWTWSKFIPDMSFHLPKLPQTLLVTAGIFFLIVPFLIGAYYVQSNFGKMLIQVRKSWSLLLVLLMVALVVILVNPGNNYLHWLPIIVPLAAFHAAAYFYPNGRWFSLLMHWVIFAYVIALNYGVFK
jgi:hypothetical protein